LTAPRSRSCRTLLALIALGIAGAALAGSYSGQKLLDALNSSAADERRFAEGYVFGIADSMQEAYPVFGLFRACIPSTATATQVVAVVKETLRREPGYLHNAAGFLVAKAVADAYPCSRAPR
jgi:hypothetical protein